MEGNFDKNFTEKWNLIVNKGLRESKIKYLSNSFFGIFVCGDFF